MAESKKSPQWAQPVHYVTTTACGGARRNHRLSHDIKDVTCRFCQLAIRQQQERERKGRTR